MPPEKEGEDDGEVSEEDEAEEIDESGNKSTLKKSPEPSAPVCVFVHNVCNSVLQCDLVYLTLWVP